MNSCTGFRYITAFKFVALRLHVLVDTANLDGDQAIGSAFDYIPGAGDDEESWAKGLTPELFWQHKQVCVTTDPSAKRALHCVACALTFHKDYTILAYFMHATKDYSCHLKHLL